MINDDNTYAMCHHLISFWLRFPSPSVIRTNTATRSFHQSIINETDDCYSYQCVWVCVFHIKLIFPVSVPMPPWANTATFQKTVYFVVYRLRGLVLRYLRRIPSNNTPLSVIDNNPSTRGLSDPPRQVVDRAYSRSWCYTLKRMSSSLSDATSWRAWRK